MLEVHLKFQARRHKLRVQLRCDSLNVVHMVTVGTDQVLATKYL